MITLITIDLPCYVPYGVLYCSTNYAKSPPRDCTWFGNCVYSSLEEHHVTRIVVTMDAWKIVVHLYAGLLLSNAPVGSPGDHQRLDSSVGRGKTIVLLCVPMNVNIIMRNGTRAKIYNAARPSLLSNIWYRLCPFRQHPWFPQSFPPFHRRMLGKYSTENLKRSREIYRLYYSVYNGIQTFAWESAFIKDHPSGYGSSGDSYPWDLIANVLRKDLLERLRTYMELATGTDIWLSLTSHNNWPNMACRALAYPYYLVDKIYFWIRFPLLQEQVPKEVSTN